MRNLKKLILLVAVFVANCGALQPAYANTQAEINAYCIQIGSIAQDVMEIRQISDRGLAYYLKQYKDNEMMQLFFQVAYEYPQFHPEVAKKVIQDFNDKFVLECLNSNRKKKGAL